MPDEPPPSSAGEDPAPITLTDLIARCLSEQLSGVDPIPFESICVDRPDLLEDVRLGVLQAGRLPALQAHGPETGPLAGTIFAERYQIEDRIGVGAMGVVYRARDLDLDRDVAIKVIHTGLMDREGLLTRFEREATALAAVSHDAVVTIYDRGVTQDASPYIVMEFVDGTSCAEILERAVDRPDKDSSAWIADEFGIESLTEPNLQRQMTTWIADLAGGLGAAHRANVFHRDVKPSNIMVRRDGRAVLIDFGIAAMEDQLTLTRTDAAVGTPAYMPPEMLSGRIRADATQDVYSLSATFYHFLTLHPPYEGTPSEVVAALSVREPKPAYRVRLGIPLDYQAVLDCGLARLPQKRYASMDAMAGDLQSILALRPVSVRPTRNVTRWWRAVRRSKAMIAVAAALFVAVLVTGLFVQRQSAKAAARQAYARLWPQLPANLGIVRSSNRYIHLQAAQDDVLATLDGLVKCGHDPIESRSVRAAFLWDHGRGDEAIRDLESIARLASSSYAAALADAHRAALEQGEPLQVEQLPAPTSDTERYLAAFASIRSGNYESALRFLGEGGANAHGHGGELDLVMWVPKFRTVRGNKMSVERAVLAVQFIDCIRSFEVSRGFTSATTGHLRSYAFDQHGSPARVLTAAEEVLSQSPYSFVTAQNAVEAYIDLEQFESAMEWAHRALELAPEYLTLHRLLIKATISDGRYDEALELLAAAPIPESPSGERQRASLRGFIELTMANETADSDPEASKRHATALLHAAAELPPDQGLRLQYEAYGRGHLERDHGLLFNALLSDLQDRPSEIRLLADLVEYWPTGALTNEQREEVIRWLKSLAQEEQAKHQGVSTD